MDVIVQTKNLYNHYAGTNYSQGKQAADKNLEKLANKKTRDSNGITMVIFDNGESELHNNLDDNSNIALRCGLDLGIRLHLAIHKLLSGKGLTMPLLIEKEAGSHVAGTGKESLQIIKRLESEKVIYEKNEKWFYREDF